MITGGWGDQGEEGIRDQEWGKKKKEKEKEKERDRRDVKTFTH